MSRRTFLQLSSALLASSALRTHAASDDRPPPRDIGRKFYADGRVHPFVGNTIICHLDQQGPNAEPFNALLDIYRDVPRHAFHRKITLLPPSSYHMTIFGCANDPQRKPGLWPEGVPLDLPMKDCDRILEERLKAAPVGDVTPIRMRVDTSPPRPNQHPLVIRLLPLDDAENRKLRGLRDRLAKITGIRSPDHEKYGFHITMAYLIMHLTDEEQRAFLTQLATWHADLARRCPVITLGQPEFCVMQDMFAFQRRFYLS